VNDKLKVFRLAPALLLFAFICWITLQANNGNNNIFFDLVILIPYGDKLGHFMLYGTLSLLAVIAVTDKYLLVNKFRIPIGAIIVLLIAIAEELTQLFLSQRTFDLLDISANIVGVFIFPWLFYKFKAIKT
jgi:VanZ family protein